MLIGLFHDFRMNHVVLVLGALVLTSARHSSAQPLCGGEGDQIPNKVCLQILEEFLRKTHTHQPEGECKFSISYFQ